MGIAPNLQTWVLPTACWSPVACAGILQPDKCLALGREPGMIPQSLEPGPVGGVQARILPGSAWPGAGSAQEEQNPRSPWRPH